MGWFADLRVLISDEDVLSRWASLVELWPFELTCDLLGRLLKAPSKTSQNCFGSMSVFLWRHGFYDFVFFLTNQTMVKLSCCNLHHHLVLLKWRPWEKSASNPRSCSLLNLCSWWTSPGKLPGLWNAEHRSPSCLAMQPVSRLHPASGLSSWHRADEWW